MTVHTLHFRTFNSLLIMSLASDIGSIRAGERESAQHCFIADKIIPSSIVASCWSMYVGLGPVRIASLPHVPLYCFHNTLCLMEAFSHTVRWRAMLPCHELHDMVASHTSKCPNRLHLPALYPVETQHLVLRSVGKVRQRGGHSGRLRGIRRMRSRCAASPMPEGSIVLWKYAR